MPSYQDVLRDPSFHELLLTIDVDLADRCRAVACPACGGALHAAAFARKPRGQPAGLSGDRHTTRFSFCCSVDGCRKRSTPPSVRFLGRKVYHATIVVIVSALCVGTGHARRRLADLLHVNRRTVSRWRSWWRNTVTATPFWKTAAAVLPPIETARLPADLLERFAGTDQQRLLALLRFLGPLTGGTRSDHTP